MLVIPPALPAPVAAPACSVNVVPAPAVDGVVMNGGTAELPTESVAVPSIQVNNALPANAPALLY
jgi:hypothetical protein